MSFKNKNCLILVPARFASTRFPGKPLANILGKSMIERVYENLIKSNQNTQFNFTVSVVTDDDRIEDHVHGFKGNVIRVDDQVSTGSERIYLGWQRFYKNDNYDLIINVQGDEPLVDPSLLERLASFHLGSNFDIATVVIRKDKRDESFEDPNKVKVIYQNDNGQCHYFSRSPIPFSRDKNDHEWFLHVGIYSYKPSALEKFNHSPKSLYEGIESLEQLRCLECGQKIGAIESQDTFIGVDTPDDIKRVEGVLRGKKQ